MPLRKWIASWILAAGFAGTLLHGRRAETAPPTTVSGPAHRPEPQTVGIASCSGRACHGGIGRRDARGNEYTTWITQDPHAKTYPALASEASRRMLKNLGWVRSIAEVRPEAETRCLNCHGRPTGSDRSFSCEACHGPANDWLRPHADRDAWNRLSAEERKRHGMAPLAEMADRARACAGCHVGSPGTQVNHDLIAAGHPRLNFEFDTYLADLPRHWQANREGKGSTAWAVGQAVSAEAALTLLAHRADPRSQLQWPEFAEYDCSACHHQPRAKAAMQRRGANGRVPGSLPWAQWYYVMPRLLEVDGLQHNLDLLAREMGRPLPSREKVIRQSQETAGRLRSWLRKDPPRFSLVARSPEINGWDAAAQWTLGLMGEYQGRARRDPAADRDFAQLFDQLRGADFDENQAAELLRSAAGRLKKLPIQR